MQIWALLLLLLEQICTIGGGGESSTRSLSVVFIFGVPIVLILVVATTGTMMRNSSIRRHDVEKARETRSIASQSLPNICFRQGQSQSNQAL